ncbi:putative zinc-binding peptidase [Allorhizobium sp. BGMRC 0089]|uniref:zinc-binding metallopeptidase family protein n=1 Tax=Allorhizobium sonneratiae TaxID=2934936 RepID=UPI0020348E10|nr:putative zinc-binding metallopeptidase [Allorhizobium sonneratiae]MCM2294583.1 putative zinc-binding peptidase [Allorhizobium sonneratiae]
MRLFSCSLCGNTVYFDNRTCLSCQARLGFRPSRMDMIGIEAGSQEEREVQFCANAVHDACNWVVDDGDASGLCRACRHNLVIPDLANPRHLDNWRRIEDAKRVLFYSLLRFALPLAIKTEAGGDEGEGLGFQFLADDDTPHNSAPVLTGHDKGCITLNIVEAEDDEREARRVALGEPFRTLVGHFRHEIAHYYWDVLVRIRDGLDGFRTIFGDEREDYAAALKRHYQQGPPQDWESRFISAYASSHPWEDFAECFAHYIHIVDALETAFVFGLRLNPGKGKADLALHENFDPYRAEALAPLIDAWIPLTVAVNSINRSMGQPDFYPFVLSQPVIEKLDYIHGLIHMSSRA